MLFEAMQLIFSNPICKLMTLAWLFDFRTIVPPIARTFYFGVFVGICNVFDIFFMITAYHKGFDKTHFTVFADCAFLIVLVALVEVQAFLDIIRERRNRNLF